MLSKALGNSGLPVLGRHHIFTISCDDKTQQIMENRLVHKLK